VGNWVLLAVGLAAVAGTKASFLPMLVAALALVIVVQLVVQRRSTVSSWVSSSRRTRPRRRPGGPLQRGSGRSHSVAGQAIEALELKVGFSSHYSSRGASLIMAVRRAPRCWGLGSRRRRHARIPAGPSLEGSGCGVLGRLPGGWRLQACCCVTPASASSTSSVRPSRCP